MILRVFIGLFSLTMWVNGLFSFSGTELNLPDSCVIGKYRIEGKINNRIVSYEEINLKPDSTFEFIKRYSSFLKIKVEGTWTLTQDTLVLNSFQTGLPSSFDVEERYNPNLKTKELEFQVQEFNNPSFFDAYELAINTVDTSIVVRGRNGPLRVEGVNLNSFQVTCPPFIYPLYEVQNPQSNSFKVSVVRKRLFWNEKWVLEGTKLKPKKMDGTFVDYYLKKEP